MSESRLPRVEVHRRARAMSGRARAARLLVQRAQAGEPVSLEEWEKVTEDLERAVELLKEAL